LVLLLLSLSIIIIIEVPGLIQKKMWRELAVFSGFLILGAIYGIIHIFEMRILNPTNITNAIFRPMFEAIDKLLK
jgi:hypothetical protein